MADFERTQILLKDHVSELTRKYRRWLLLSATLGIVVTQAGKPHFLNYAADTGNRWDVRCADRLWCTRVSECKEAGRCL